MESATYTRHLFFVISLAIWGSGLEVEPMWRPKPTMGDEAIGEAYH